MAIYLRNPRRNSRYVDRCQRDLCAIAEVTMISGHQLAYMAGILHRDVSPGNVMITEESKRFKGFITDFDYSSLIDSSADGGTPLTSDELAVLSSRDAELRERTVCILCANMST